MRAYLSPGEFNVSQKILKAAKLATDEDGYVRRVVAGRADLTAEQAAVMLGYPVWMTVVFAVGVFGGAIGCLLMLARSAVAVPVFALSLFGYIALYIGDIIHGVFAAMGTPQVVVLTVVVAIAAGLWAVARLFRTRGVLA